jgi:predicted esterase
VGQYHGPVPMVSVSTLLLSCSLLAGGQATPTYQAGRFEMGERLKTVEAAWMEATPERKKLATPSISMAVMSFFAQRTGDACRALDQAAALLDGRTLRPEDSANLRFVPPVVEPGGKATLVVTWAYPPSKMDELVLKAGDVTAKVKPGAPQRILVPAASLPVSQDTEDEVGLLVPGTIGAVEKGSYLSVVHDLPRRLEVLLKSARSSVQVLAGLIQEQISGQPENEAPILEVLALAEGLESGRIKEEAVRFWPRAKEGDTILRAALPPLVREDTPLVVAIHGAGGSENLFFEGYGRGKAVVEALRRGWSIVAPRASRTAVADAVAWRRRVTGKAPNRIILMGHSMGGGAALSAGSVRPSQVVLFAPAASRVPDDLTETPIWLGVGRQEIPALFASSERIAAQMQSAPGFTRREYDPCEHLMIVAEGLSDAYSWLDQQTPKG